MADAARKRLTIDEFLAQDDGTDRRTELVHGEIVAMAPPEQAHGAICVNIGAALKARLRPPCHAVAEAGIVLPDRNDTYYQADLAVTCSPMRPGARYLEQPLLVIEVLSPSTMTYDRGGKLPDYRSIAAVQEILLVSSAERRIEHWRRTEEGWAVVEQGNESVLRIAALDIILPLEEIYEGVAFAADAQPGG